MIKQTSLLFFIIIIKLTSLLYASGKNDSSYHQLDPLQVKAKAIEGKVITITEIEADIGKHEDVNHLVYMNPGIQRVPETGSQLLVNGGSIYDNQYYLNNIPMFIPAHFSGHYIFDINSLLVPSLQNFNLILHTISGNFAGASNSVILVEPGIFTVNNKNPRHRPEVLLTLATYDAGICISTPFRKGKHHYQVTANFPNSFFIKFKNERDNSFICVRYLVH